METKPIQDEFAESAVISSVLMDKDCIDNTINILDPADFYNPQHGILFETVKKMQGTKQVIDLVTITSFLAKEGNLEKIGGPGFVASFIKGTVNSENVIYYANIVKEKSLMRQIVQKSKLIAEEAEKGKDVEENAQGIIQLSRMVPGDIHTVKSLRDLLPSTMKDIEKRIELGKNVSGYETGYTTLDKMFLGIRKREFFIVAGRPSHGKTAFALNLAGNLIKNNIPVLFFSFEMGEDELTERLLAVESRLTFNKILAGKLQEREIQHLTHTIVKIEGLPLYFDTDHNEDIKRIEKVVREFKIKQKEFVMIIDYLQLMKTTEGNTREQQISYISRRLKNLGMQENILMIALSQLNRNVEYRGKNAKPILSDLRESGSLEQDADIVLFLHRDQENIFNDNPIETIEFFLAKRRNGTTGKTKLTFHKKYTRFDNYIKEGLLNV